MDKTRDKTSAGEPVDEGAAGGTDRRGCVAVVLGVGMIIIGIPMLICPGPGIAMLISGAGMVAAGLGFRVKKES